jgi:hypothetical protein
VNQQAVLGVVALVSAIGGFLLKWALPPARSVADGEVNEAEQAYQRALARELAAKQTPSKDDDAAAEKQAELARRTLIAKRRLANLLKGLDDVA